MELKFDGTDRDHIKKMDWWSSDTFLVYIHDQITEYSEGWTNKWQSKGHILIWKELLCRGQKVIEGNRRGVPPLYAKQYKTGHR